ncbi:MAG: prephenate dehydratase [Methylococcales bacterium]|jgi:chorismate mutase/prephenate dehydratase|nr:prephenate dehydratase [Methylococcaceae bacterium]HIL41007.1 prephenate dehydratase [Methylococcales bacterium]
MTSLLPLNELRNKIDTIDQSILTLINQRAALAIEVAKTKMAAGDDGCFYRPDREALVLRRIREINEGPLDDDVVISFFREIMSACLALEKPLAVAFLGPEGTFTQQAAVKHFGQGAHCVPASSINDIFWAVENKHCQFGVVPVENSTGGVITHTLDRFTKSELSICGEVEIRVNQNLMTRENDLSAISTVFSHEQSLKQCQKWLDENLPGVLQKSVSSNAEAAKLAAEQENSAAIAPVVAAGLYGLNILQRNIEDEADNTTRFLIIGDQRASTTGDDKTTLLISTGNQSGALHKILQPFAKYNISMTRIESRPSRQGLWEYVFFIDIEGHIENKEVSLALSELKDSVNMLTILGSYPRAVI